MLSALNGTDSHLDASGAFDAIQLHPLPMTAQLPDQNEVPSWGLPRHRASDGDAVPFASGQLIRSYIAMASQSRAVAMMTQGSLRLCLLNRWI